MFDSALNAIAKHNLVHEPIDFRTEPIAALLALCDELQDWGRPRWDSEAFASEVLGWLHFDHGSRQESARLCRSMQIQRPKGSCPGKIQLEYNDPIAHKYNPGLVTAFKLRAMQRLKNLPQITLVLRIPIKHQWKNKQTVNEDFSFRSAIRKFQVRRDYPVFRPEVLWPDVGEKPPVRWEVEEGCYDIVTVELDKINEFCPVLGFPPDFRDEFTKFIDSLASK